MLPLFLVVQQGCKSLSTPGFLCLGGMCISPKLSRGLELSWGLRGTEEGPVRSAVWSQVQENTWHSISSQETNDVGPAQPFASLTSHGSLSVCFLIWWVEMHSHVHFQSEHRDSVEKSGRSPWQMPGPQYSTCGAALSVCVTHRAIFLHPQASGLARTPGASG